MDAGMRLHPWHECGVAGWISGGLFVEESDVWWRDTSR